MLSQMVRFPSSLWLNNIPVCVFIFNSFTSGRFSLLPCLGHYQQCCSEHGLQIALWVSVSVVLRKIPRSRTVRLYGRSIFNFLRKFHSVFYSGCTTLHTPPIIRRGTFLPTLAICCLSVRYLSNVRRRQGQNKNLELSVFPKLMISKEVCLDKRTRLTWYNASGLMKYQELAFFIPTLSLT